jgi:HemK-like putative methylase
VLDLCTGTGCIPLLLHHLLSPKFSALELLGVDISPKALKLAQDNLLHNVNAGILPNEALDQVSFAKADLLCEDGLAQALSYQRWDIVISNPPYISQAGFAKDTQRSVRNWEPRLALVPSPAGYQVSIPASHPEDIFYHRILAIAKGAKARIVVMEVGDLEQGARVVKLALEMGAWKEVEIWRDWPSECEEGEGEARDVDVGGTQVPVNGVGLGRSVVCRR